MTVYKGELKYISGSAPYLAGQAITREFIEIGDNRIKKVVLNNYLDTLLVRFLGQEVALSGVKIWGRFHVLAIKEPNGQVSKSGLSRLLYASFLLWPVGGSIGGGIFYIGWMGGPNLLSVPFMLVGGFILLYSVYTSIVLTVSSLRAWFAL